MNKRRRLLTMLINGVLLQVRQTLRLAMVVA